MLNSLVKKFLNQRGIDIRRIQPVRGLEGISHADPALYRPTYAPWYKEGPFRTYYEIAVQRSLVDVDRCYMLYTLLTQSLMVEGSIWECGVYKGGTAAMMAKMLSDLAPDRKLFLFDTYEGMPPTDSDKDLHRAGDFSDTSLESVQTFVGHPELSIFRKGFIPDTFAGLESEKIAFAHIDVDIYRSIIDSLEFIWPRLSRGGSILFDDYGLVTCPGARLAVDEFFQGNPCRPICLHNGQAIVFKS